MHPSDVEDIEVDLFVEAMRRRHGYDFGNYARASLKRRVQAVAAHYGAEEITELTRRMLRDQEHVGDVIARLSVPVSDMFRDPDVFATLRTEVLPVLASYPRIRIWHAGCATGEEVYSMAILLQEEGLYDRCQIYATDFNDTALEQAREGIYAAADLRKYSDHYRRAGGKRSLDDYFHSGYGRIRMIDDLRRNVTFANHNLVSDGVFAEVHLVICRNVLIYFNDTLKNLVLGLFRDSLVRQGFLCLGNKETLSFSPVAADFTMFDGPARIYRRDLYAV